MEREYWSLVGAANGKKPSKRKLAKAAKVLPNNARKIIAEISNCDNIIPVEDLKLERSDERVQGVGSKVLTLEEQMFLLEL